MVSEASSPLSGELLTGDAIPLVTWSGEAGGDISTPNWNKIHIKP